MNKTQLLQGTLDLLVLRILELGPNHGWGISSRLQQISKDGLKTSQGSLYPALHRLEMRGEVKSEMTASENNRRARVYTITRAGRKRLTARNRDLAGVRAVDAARPGRTADDRRVCVPSPRCVDCSAAAASTARSSRSSRTISSARSTRTAGVASRPKRHVGWPLRDLGGLTQTIESTRASARPGSTRSGATCRYGARLLRRSPRFTVTALTVLVLGIGSTTAIFSIAYAVLVRPLPYADAGAPGLSGRTPGLRHRVAELRRLAPARHVVRRHRELAGRRGVRHGRRAPAAARLEKRDRELLWRARRDAAVRAASSTSPMPGPTPRRRPS